MTHACLICCVFSRYSHEAGPYAGGQLLNEIIMKLKEAVKLKPAESDPEGSLGIEYCVCTMLSVTQGI